MLPFTFVEGLLRLAGVDPTHILDIDAAGRALVKDADVKAAVDAVTVALGPLATQATLLDVKNRADLLATEATLANVLGAIPSVAALASEATMTAGFAAVLAALGPLGTEVTLAALKARADLLASEATAANILAALGPLATEATLAALKARGDLLATEATLANVLAAINGGAGGGATETTLDRLADRADLLATEVTAANIHARLLALIGDAVANPAANTLGDRLKAIHTRLNDETTRALIGIVRTADFAAAADAARGMPSLDDRYRMRVISNPGRLGPNRRPILRYGTISTNSAAFVALTNGTTAVTNFPAQAIDYTPPVGTRFLLCQFGISHVDKNGAEIATMAIKAGAGGNRELMATTTSSGFNDPRTLATPKEYAAGTAVLVDVRTSGGTSAVMCWFYGIEEDIA